MLTKYANHEAILEIKTASERLSLEPGEGAMLAKFAKTTSEPEVEDGYVYVRTRAISSRVNKNNDGWPSEELASAYRSFVGRPVFVDHNNSDPRRTRGVIVDAKLHVEDDKTSALDPYYSSAPDNHKPPTWIELLIEVDGKTYPKLAQAIKKGDIDATSMGANIEKSVCSVCGNEATVPTEYCKHVQQKGSTFEITADNGEKVQKKAYEDCYGVNFFEDSFVFDPADETALNIGVDDKLVALAALKEGFVVCHNCSGKEFNAIGGGDYPVGQIQCKTCGEIHSLNGDETGGFDPEKFHHGTLPVMPGSEILSKVAAPVGEAYDWQAVVQALAQLGLSSGTIRQAVEGLKQGADPEDVLPGVPGAADAIRQSAGQSTAKVAAPGDDSVDRELNYEPQSDKDTAPAKVDTLRDDIKCPNCGVDVLDSDPDGILRCPTCAYEQPPDGLDNPDLGMAREVDKDKTVGDDVDDSDVIRATDEDADDDQFIKPLGESAKESATNSNVPTGVISEMNWTKKIATDSAAEANEALESIEKTAAVVTMPYPGGQGIHNGTSAAFTQAGITAVVTAEGMPMPLALPFQNPNAPVFIKMLQAQGVLVAGKPISVESDNPEAAVQLINQLSGDHTAAANDKRTPNKKNVVVPSGQSKGDAPANERVVGDQLEPVTADRRVIKREETPDGHRTEQIVEETGDLLADEPKDEKKDDEKKDNPNEPKAQKEREAEENEDGEEDKKDSTPPWLKKKEPVAASVDPHEKLLAALAVAEQAVEMGVVESQKKMAFVGQLEDESMEEIEARRRTLALVKSAGLSTRKLASKRPASSLPRLAYAQPSVNGKTDLDDIPFEAVFL